MTGAIPPQFRGVVNIAVQLGRLCRRIDCCDCYAIMVMPVPLLLSIVPILRDRNPRSVNSFLRKVFCAVVTTRPFLTTEGMQSSSCRRGWQRRVETTASQYREKKVRSSDWVNTFSPFPSRGHFRVHVYPGDDSQRKARWVSGNTYVCQRGAEFESVPQYIDSSGRSIVMCFLSPSRYLPG